MGKLNICNKPLCTRQAQNNYTRWKKQYLKAQCSRKGFLGWLWDTVWNYVA
ncbi:MAG: hypothetical protein HQL61_07720 [Magnetococcales bacterium]|nr:hypothetical protein [Nitrospirota bacterium]